MRSRWTFKCIHFFPLPFPYGAQRDYRKFKAAHLNSIIRDTAELQWLEHLWDHENMFKTGVVRANEGRYVRRYSKDLFDFI